MYQLPNERVPLITDCHKTTKQSADLCRLAKDAIQRAASMVTESRLHRINSGIERRADEDEMQQCRAEIAALMNGE